MPKGMNFVQVTGVVTINVRSGFLERLINTKARGLIGEDCVLTSAERVKIEGLTNNDAVIGFGSPTKLVERITATGARYFEARFSVDPTLPHDDRIRLIAAMKGTRVRKPDGTQEAADARPDEIKRLVRLQLEELKVESQIVLGDTFEESQGDHLRVAAG